MTRTTSHDTDFDQEDPPRKRSSVPPIVWVVGGFFALIGLVLWIIFGFIIPNNVLNEGNKREAELNKSYSNAANYLSDCVIKTTQTAHVASANAAAFTDAIEAAISGDGDNPAAHVDTTTAAGRANLLPILVQAYPD